MILAWAMRYMTVAMRTQQFEAIHLWYSAARDDIRRAKVQCVCNPVRILYTLYKIYIAMAPRPTYL